MVTAGHGLTIRVEARIAAIDAAAWDACANPDPARCDPFVSHAFLAALETSGSIAPATGWFPQHLVLRDADGGIAGCMPAYLKSHSLGEFVFDHAWADAYERNGVAYYPKLLAAVPVTPVPGRRFLVRPGPDAERDAGLLLAGAIELTRRHDASSLHITFLTEAELARCVSQGLLARHGQQFHWVNDGYGSFDDFLASLASRKRKVLKRERREALKEGISVEWLRGSDITPAHWDAFFAFYMDTGGRKWGSPYLNRRFFTLLGEAMADRVLLVMCRRDGRYIAGALNMIGGETLYGRYWGCLENHPFLHFETCYYQAIDFAIANRLKRVEAGAGGEHKLVRGYEPVTTHSAHWIADPRFRAAIARYLEQEREAVARENAALMAYTPFRKTDPADEQSD